MGGRGEGRGGGGGEEFARQINNQARLIVSLMNTRAGRFRPTPPPRPITTGYNGRVGWVSHRKITGHIEVLSRPLEASCIQIPWWFKA